MGSKELPYPWIRKEHKICPLVRLRGRAWKRYSRWSLDRRANSRSRLLNKHHKSLNKWTCKCRIRCHLKCSNSRWCRRRLVTLISSKWCLKFNNKCNQCSPYKCNRCNNKSHHSSKTWSSDETTVELLFPSTMATTYNSKVQQSSRRETSKGHSKCHN